MAKSPNKSKKTAPPQEPYDRLSFIANRNKAGLPDGRFPRCFWNVKATGRYAEDCDTGAMDGTTSVYRALKPMEDHSRIATYQWRST